MCVGHAYVCKRAIAVNGPQQQNQAYVIAVQERDATTEILQRMTGDEREALAFEDHGTSVRLQAGSSFELAVVACLNGKDILSYSGELNIIHYTKRNKCILKNRQ